jgi:thioredoxin-dependent peroxiredoxin
VAARYGVWVERSRGGRTYWGNERTTFLIDPEGVVARVFPRVRPEEHDDLVLGALASVT